MNVPAGVLQTFPIDAGGAGSHIIGPFDQQYSNEIINLAATTVDLPPGTLLGKIATAGLVSAVKASGANTGTGTFVVDATDPVLADGQVGIYTLRCIKAVANGGVFRLKDPAGKNVGDYEINPPGAGASVTISDQVKGVLTDGGTDFVVGDGFDLTVSAGTGLYKQIDPTATDGSADVAAVLWHLHRVNTSAAKAVGTVRRAEMNGNFIPWVAFGGGNLNSAQKAKAIAQLNNMGIVARQI